jgi:hypothetical protein
MTEYIIKINSDDYPMLLEIKEKNLNKILSNIFKTGYDLYFPNKDKSILNDDINNLRSELCVLKKDVNESDIVNIGNTIMTRLTDKIDPLTQSLNKLLGLQTASSKKGELGENIIEHMFKNRYGDITYEDKSGIAHSGDAWITLYNNIKVMVESKNYTNTIGKSEIEKAEYDMKHNNIRFCLFISLNGNIQNFREMDFHTFTHESNNYFMIIVANLSNDMTRLDLAFSMIRKLTEMFNNVNKFPWIQKKIQDSLNMVNNIFSKNYTLRDNFYNMEKVICGSLDMYHKELRNYQYEMEQSIKNLTQEINSTMICSIEDIKTNSDIFSVHKSKKNYNIISRIADLLDKHKCNIVIKSESKYEVFKNDNNIGVVDIIVKKIVYSVINTIDIIFNNNNIRINEKNYSLLETYLE